MDRLMEETIRIKPDYFIDVLAASVSLKKARHAASVNPHSGPQAFGPSGDSILGKQWLWRAIRLVRSGRADAEAKG